MVKDQHIVKVPFIVRFNMYLAGFLLLLAALAKLVSASGSARILQATDPILTLSFQGVFEVVGGLECIVALVCFFSRRVELKAALLAWLATSFYFTASVWHGVGIIVHAVVSAISQMHYIFHRKRLILP